MKIKNIEQLKIKNIEIKQRNKKMHEEFDELINEILYELYAQEEDITYTYLDSLEKGNKVILPSALGGNISFERIDKDNRMMTFDVNFSEGATLPKHYHSDSFEEIEVVKDDVVSVILTNPINKTVTKKYLKQGDILVIQPNTIHQITSQRGKMMKVRFYKY